MTRFAVPLALVLALLGSTDALAQSETQLWIETAASYRVTKPFRVAVAGNLRFDEDISRVSAAMPEVVAQYRVQPWLRFYAGYRYAYKRRGNGDFEHAHRVHADARFIVRPGPARVDYRLRYQELARSRPNRHTLRNRLSASVKAPYNLIPFAAFELFHRLDQGDTVHLHKERLTVGSGFTVGDVELAAFYRAEFAQNDPTDPSLHILGLGFGYDL